MKTFAQEAKSIQNKYKNRKDKLSMDSMHRELAALEQKQEMLRESMNLIDNQQVFAYGGKTKMYSGLGPFDNTIHPMFQTEESTGYQIPYSPEYTQYVENTLDAPAGTPVEPFNPNSTINTRKVPGTMEIDKKPNKFNYNNLIGYGLQAAGPLMDIYYGTKKDKVNYDRIVPRKINLAPKTMAELMMKSASPAYWLAKNQSLGQGSLLNTLGTISGNIADKTGEAYLNAKLQQEKANAEFGQQGDMFNAQVQMNEAIDRLKE